MNIKIAPSVIAFLAIVSLAAHAGQHDARPGGKQAPVEAGSTAVNRVTAPDAAPSCQAAYNRQRNNCTILSSRCGAGVFPVAHPPGCSCSCVRAGNKESEQAPAASAQGK